MSALLQNIVHTGRRSAQAIKHYRSGPLCYQLVAEAHSDLLVATPLMRVYWKEFPVAPVCSQQV
jgi:hypothetical protein